MIEARCQCGQFAATLPGRSPAVVACHCEDRQRRTGTPFGVLAYYPADAVTVRGEWRRFERPTASGGLFETRFYPTCGTTLLSKAGKHPDLIGVAVGAIGDPDFPPPVRPVWEERGHRRVTIPAAEHFPRGRV